MEENFSMEWNMEENFTMQWNMKWKIFGMEWKKIASMEYNKKSNNTYPVAITREPAMSHGLQK